MTDTKLRIAIVNADKCKPKNCALECKKKCPSNTMGKMCIEVTNENKVAIISEVLCLPNCNICVKQCPFGAISVINLPKEFDKKIPTHRYGSNQFKLFGLPTPRPNQVLGLIGQNALGKSLTLKILSGQKPNLGKFDNVPSWDEILVHYRGTELQHYFTKLIEEKMVAKIKPQYVDQIPRAVNGVVGELLKSKAYDNNVLSNIIQCLDLTNILERNVSELSGGELQRFAIAVLCIQDIDIYLFDEPSSYLDIKQRLNAARTIHQLCENKDKMKYVVAIEHDLSVCDYLSDYVSILYGVPGVYGSVTMPFSVRDGINIFLDGFIPTENLRFREEALTFKINDNIEEYVKRHALYTYPEMIYDVGNFHLHIKSGSFTDSEIIVMLAENGCGKTCFIKMLAGVIKMKDMPEFKVSYKPQHISPTFSGSVRELLFKNLGTRWQHPQFQSDVYKPLQIESLLDNIVKTLSGGELQRVALILALGKPADIYLIDEPSAYLDSEQRIIVAKVIKRFIIHARKTAFIVEHDFIMSSYLADRVIVYEGIPSVSCTATEPQSLTNGMNFFLKTLDVTLRRDKNNFRPRINKQYSQMDTQQKHAGNYFHHEQ